MKNKKDFLPIIIASVIALIITGIVRWFMPSTSSRSSGTINTQKDISMPEIPLMAAKPEKKKVIENYVLVVSRNITKNEKIVSDQLTWKKWPHEAMQPYFIAKDEHETPLNNGADYTNAFKMWAKSDIPSGVPLTMTLLTSEDPKKREEEERKKLEEERMHAFVRSGMRAITFPIDQKSASSSHMFGAGDLVDVLIMEQRGDKAQTHKYKAIKILAIDGVTKFTSKASEKQGDTTSFLESVSMRSVGGFLTPKNVTLEIKEEMVERMLKQSANSGVILSIRNQAEEVDEEGVEEITDENTAPESNSILSNIMNLNQSNPTDDLVKEKVQKEAEEKNLEALMNNISMINNIEDSTKTTSKAVSDNTKGKSKGKSKDGEKSSGNQYEVASGKIVGEEPGSEPNVAVVYRKLTPTAVQFDDDGKVATGENYSGGSGMASGFSNSGAGRSGNARSK